MKSRRHIPALGTPIARYLALQRIAPGLADAAHSPFERRILRTVATGLFRSLPEQMQHAFARWYRDACPNNGRSSC